MGRGVLEVRNLRRRFAAVDVLRGVDLAVQPDELVALVGENGAGKTTLVRCIAGALAPDAGGVWVDGEPVPRTGAPSPGVEVVWQDLALCDNLDVIDNLFLGREDRALLSRREDEQVRARALFDELGVAMPDPDRPVASFSGGQRQTIALVRTLVRPPALLVLDEPTGSLDSAGVRAVRSLLKRMRAERVAILLVSHDLDLVCEVADRALVLRDGRISHDVARPDLTPDLLRGCMSGLEADVLARQQLHGLRSLVDQLAEVEPTDVLPLVVSAVGVALEQPRLALHLHRGEDGVDVHGAVLRLGAGLGLTARLRAQLERVVGPTPADSPLAGCLQTRRPVVISDLRDHDSADAAALVAAGIRSMWAVPLVAGHEVLGTLSGYDAAAGGITAEALELASLYAAQAAAALERDRFLATVTRRNRTLETLRQVLETLAGPVEDDAGLAIALEALRVGLGAESLALVDPDGEGADGVRTDVAIVHAVGEDDGSWVQVLALPHAADGVARRPVEDRAVLAATVSGPGRQHVLAARWAEGESPRDGATELLVDGAHSVLLALDRRAHEDARQEATALRRSNDLQRTFLARLSHELRTPLTAIHGYADTLRQPDVAWDHSSTRRFLDTIARESERLGDLVTDLLDASAIEAGVLRLQLHWCEVGPIVEAAVACLPRERQGQVDVEVPAGLPAIWADHGRLQQALVNLVGNAVRHTPEGTAVGVRARLVDDAGAEHLQVAVVDDGPGLPAHVVEAPFVAGTRGSGDGAGLGMSIAHGIVRAHGGTVDLQTGPRGTTVELTLPVEGPVGDDPGWALDGGAGQDGRTEART